LALTITLLPQVLYLRTPVILICYCRHLNKAFMKQKYSWDANERASQYLFKNFPLLRKDFCFSVYIHALHCLAWFWAYIQVKLLTWLHNKDREGLFIFKNNHPRIKDTNTFQIKSRIAWSTSLTSSVTCNLLSSLKLSNSDILLYYSFCPNTIVNDLWIDLLIY